MKLNWKKINALFIFEIIVFFVSLVICRFAAYVLYTMFPPSPVISGLFITLCLYLGFFVPKHAKLLLKFVMKS